MLGSRTLFHFCNIPLQVDSNSQAMGLEMEKEWLMETEMGKNFLEIKYQRSGTYYSQRHIQQQYSLSSLIYIKKTVKPQLFERFISVFNQDQEDLVQRLTNMDTENRGLERELSRLQVCTVVYISNIRRFELVLTDNIFSRRFL